MPFRSPLDPFLAMLLTTAIVSSGLAQTQSETQSESKIAVTYVFGPNETKFVYGISSQRAETLPPWDQQLSVVPPLSLGDAIKTAENWLMKQREVKTLELRYVRLEEFVPPSALRSICARVACWSYRLIFDPVIGGRRLIGGADFTAVVLLDGSIVESTVEPPPPVQLTLNYAGSPRPTPAGVYVARDGVTYPAWVRSVTPKYSAAALQGKIHGSVVLDFVVDTSGKVTDLTLLNSLDAEHRVDTEAVVDAVRQWVFTPGMLMGTPVPVILSVIVKFSSR